MNRAQIAALETLNHDNIFRFRVKSRSQPDVEHVVDVAAHDGIGECSCQHFQFRLLPAIKKGLATQVQQVRCAHILAGRDACLNALIQMISAQEKAYEDEAPAETGDGPAPDKANRPALRQWICPECQWSAEAAHAPAAREAINKNPDFKLDCQHFEIHEKPT